jgi:hypothetical protein
MRRSRFDLLADGKPSLEQQWGCCHDLPPELGMIPLP